ncbi:hypothetical protein Y032_0454g1746 [Ancylostoma ceylanicum]|uniref:Uncharacterized protein n=1 Tax=Ancylostoma ceylanicum TaxID=53326 RepID=A0A016WXY8_9BILA|nr:hypothetical protein Y032_0454g1746 [Ancylostoma ceylanicum]
MFLEFRPQKRARSASRDNGFNDGPRLKVGPSEFSRVVKRNRIIDDEPIIITKVIPNWPRPTVTTTIPPPPPPQILTSPRVIIAPPPPAVPPGMVVPFLHILRERYA